MHRGLYVYLFGKGEHASSANSPAPRNTSDTEAEQINLAHEFGIEGDGKVGARASRERSLGPPAFPTKLAALALSQRVQQTNYTMLMLNIIYSNSNILNQTLSCAPH